MKIFQDMSIRVDGDPSAVADRIAAVLPDRWCRDKEREDRTAPSVQSRIYTFVLTQGAVKYALLVLCEQQTSLGVANIIPLQKGEFSKEEYNNILADFVSVLNDHRFTVDLGKSEVDLSDLISEIGAKKLRTFSDCANKSTGRSHPMDERRWLDWLLFMVREHHTIDFDDLVYFLGQHGWDDETAYKLALDYSYGTRAMEYALENSWVSDEL
jgi:hypothetical protein